MLLYGGYPLPGPTKTQLASLITLGGGKVFEMLDDIWKTFFDITFVSTRNCDGSYIYSVSGCCRKLCDFDSSLLCVYADVGKFLHPHILLVYLSVWFLCAFIIVCLSLSFSSIHVLVS